MAKKSSLPVTVMLADDHALIRKGVSELLKANGIEVVAEAATTEETIISYLSLINKPSVLVLDLNMPGTGGGGFTLVDTILTYDSQARILIYSMRENLSLVNELYDKGVFGYLSKSSSPDFLVKAISTIAQGKRYFMAAVSDALEEGHIPPSPSQVLNKNELTAFILLAEGKSHEEIAKHLKITTRTLSNRLLDIRRKLNDAPISSFGWIARKHGLLSLDEL